MPDISTTQAYANYFRHCATVTYLDWPTLRKRWQQLPCDPAELGCDDALVCLGFAKRDSSGETCYRSRGGEAWLPPVSARPESVGALQAIERRYET